MTDFRVNVPGDLFLAIKGRQRPTSTKSGAMYATTHEIRILPFSRPVVVLLFGSSLIQGNRGHSWVTGSPHTIEEADRLLCYGF